MFVIYDNLSIYLTRGDIATINVSASTPDSEYTFVAGDVVRLRIFEKKHHELVVLQKDVVVDSDTSVVSIFLSKDDTKIGELINKPTDFWYEIELNPDTVPQTIVGYDDDGPKIFRLFPEGDDLA